MKQCFREETREKREARGENREERRDNREERRSDAGRDPWELLGEFWEDFLAERTAGRLHRADGQHFEAMPWGSNGHVDEELHRIGCWFMHPLTTEMPPFSGAVKKATWRTWRERGAPQWEEYGQAMHSSNLHALRPSLEHGLVAGPATKAGLHGVYMYETDDLGKARSSSGYRVYSSFDHKAYFWSVVYECAYYGKFHASRVGKMSAGNGQQAAKEGTFHVVAVWFHCLHVSEMHDAARAGLTANADFLKRSTR